MAAVLRGWGGVSEGGLWSTSIDGVRPNMFHRPRVKELTPVAATRLLGSVHGDRGCEGVDIECACGERAIDSVAIGRLIHYQWLELSIGMGCGIPSRRQDVFSNSGNMLQTRDFTIPKKCWPAPPTWVQRPMPSPNLPSLIALSKLRGTGDSTGLGRPRLDCVLNQAEEDSYK
ncbi:hypothetical protein JB92DRAFT_2830857 [Gautieria morchelliformis]|nr:hypothetical protein JB92DRAFT_2830857 [Gautieria morchelliformis]